MRPLSLILAVLSGVFLNIEAVPVVPTAVPRQLPGSLALVDEEPLFTFKYSTSDPNPTNWIGLYHASGGGPDDEEYVAPSLVWKYAPEAAGRVELSPSALQPGSYKAFFLAKDGYKWLAEPIEVDLRDPNPISFIVDEATLHNARQGDPFEAVISGLLSGGGATTAEFTKLANEGDGWVDVRADGTITGVPGPSDQRTQVVIEATASDGSTARMDVVIPVRPAGKPLVKQLSVLTYNLWHGGTQVDDYHRKQVRFLVNSGVDVVGVQESTGGHATRLAKALGWFAWQGADVGIISRYPIVESYIQGGYGGSVRIELDGEASQINIWNVHLGYDPYGPYDFCFDNMTVEQVLRREAISNRTPQIAATMAAMREQLAGSDAVPVLLLGDFNAPSHLDWTEALREKNCGRAGVPWPTSVQPVEAGMVDSFREAHADPAVEQGITWSPIYRENGGRPEPLDRIDFIYHKGRMKVLESESLVAGDPAPMPDHNDNEWTSDHAAVRTVFSVRQCAVQNRKV